MARNLFNTVLAKRPKSNVFDLSHDVKLSFDMGQLVPIMCMEAVPGDKFNVSNESMLRFAPLIAPIMHKVDVYTHTFFVPNRILWSGWEDFITGGRDGNAAPAFPVFNRTVTPSSLADYLGLPLASSNIQVSGLPFAAYQCIYNEYYRDQNLIAPVPFELVDGLNPTGSFGTIRNRAWQHDYFTSALPWAQRGDAVNLPLISENADIEVLRNNANTANDFSAEGVVGTDPAVAFAHNRLSDNSSISPDRLYIDGEDIQTQATTINDLRRAFRLQEWLEKNARGGARYIESILSHFGVRSSDARLQRPEYLGGSKQPMVISEVLQTSESSATAQGNMSGHGISVGAGRSFSYRCEEHGYVMTIMSVMPKTAYQQGIPRHFLKTDKLMYYWPSFAHLGEQEILNKELYVGFDAADNETFGYTPRYSEYKYMDSRVAGEFRNELSYWHMGRIFSSRPNLNENFVTADPTTRVFAVIEESNNKIYAHVYHKIKAIRPMPKYGTPAI